VLFSGQGDYCWHIESGHHLSTFSLAVTINVIKAGAISTIPRLPHGIGTACQRDKLLKKMANVFTCLYRVLFEGLPSHSFQAVLLMPPYAENLEKLKYYQRSRETLKGFCMATAGKYAWTTEKQVSQQSLQRKEHRFSRWRSNSTVGSMPWVQNHIL